jgi:hypothetical protein
MFINFFLNRSNELHPNLSKFLFFIYLVIILQLINACGGSAGGGGATKSEDIGKNKTIGQAIESTGRNINELSIILLSSEYITRDPTLDTPNNNVIELLDSYDSLISSYIVPYEKFTQPITAMLDEIGIVVPLLKVDIEQNFFNSGFEVLGGTAGLNAIYLDGKYLDILQDFSNYLALHDLSPIHPLGSMDGLIIELLVEYHFSSPLKVQYKYPVESLNSEQAQSSIDIFNGISSFILYHEFSHLYFYHAVSNFQLIENAVNQMLSNKKISHISFTSENEDLADLFAGMLLKRSQNSIVHANIGLDVMTYIGYFLTSDIEKFEYIYDESFIQNNSSELYSNLTLRRGLVLFGYNSY